ncbi:uncharacterized protein LOC133926973 isoform X1 [Phragmites australis]|uniref:uncharacterized protein LOC133926973 isoform X1 n=1 Tax=Phragmites australis TaxID=29695 RepID=UPI002D7994A8|nr:uncharacterized protein LOC133926973 isoform X1 [Phragmites australis]
MRFFKGSKVEVLQEAEVPLGSWRPAEIVSGNGHGYLVRYHQSPVDSSVAVERVPRRLMRPCPPPSDDPVCWTVGSILEAFDSYSWKVAEVVRVLGKNHYLVRLLGSSLELRAHGSDLRLRMLWQEDKWIVTQKYSARCLDGSFRGRPKDGSFGYKLGNQQLHCAMDQNAFEGNMSRGMKRKLSAISTHPPQCSEITKRLLTPHRDGRRSKVVDRGSLRLAEKVDAVDSPCFMLGEKYMHASLNMKTNGNVKTNLSGINADASYKRGTRTSADLSDTESISSSVGSSSPNSSPHRSQYYNLAYQSGDICSRTDDAEASISERETSEYDNDGSRQETHLLELHAYRATMLALYTCGSISWEQEALLTNLRLTLNISTDEHLAELRNLVSQAVTSR